MSTQVNSFYEQIFIHVECEREENQVSNQKCTKCIIVRDYWITFDDFYFACVSLS